MDLSFLINKLVSPFITIKKIVKTWKSKSIVTLYILTGGINTCLCSFYMEKYKFSSAFGLSFQAILIYSFIISVIISSCSVIIIPLIIKFYSELSLEPGATHWLVESVFWSVSPLAIRQLFRFFFMIFTKAPIWTAGMAGFLSKDILINKFIAGALQSIDLFFLFHFILIIKGLKSDDFLHEKINLISVFIAIAAVLLLRALVNLLVPFPILLP